MARGGRGGGSRNPANLPREQQVSRKVSWLLRHGAGQEGLKLGKGGYVNVQDAVCLLSYFLTSYSLHALAMRKTLWTWKIQLESISVHVGICSN